MHLGAHHEELRRAGHARRRLLALNTEPDLKRLIAYAERYPKGATPTSIPGGREVADALSLGERMTVLRELRAAIKPEVATWTPNVKDKVLCAGSWLPAGEAPVYEDTTSTVGDRTYAIKTVHAALPRQRLEALGVGRRAVAAPRGQFNRAASAGKRVVELGSGVGLVARVACDLGAVGLATDGEERLLDVVRANAPTRPCGASTGPRRTCPRPFDVVLGADLIYSSGAIASGLLETCTSLCRPGGTLLLCVPAGRHGLDELVNAINQDARWGAAAVERFSRRTWPRATIPPGRSDAVEECAAPGARADPLALRRSGQLPASSGFCGEPSGLPLPRRRRYVPHPPREASRIMYTRCTTIRRHHGPARRIPGCRHWRPWASSWSSSSACFAWSGSELAPRAPCRRPRAAATPRGT